MAPSKNANALRLYSLVRREAYAANKNLKKPLSKPRLDKIIHDQLFDKYRGQSVRKVKRKELRDTIEKSLKKAAKPPASLARYAKLLTIAVEINKSATVHLALSELRTAVSTVYPLFKPGNGRFNADKARKLLAAEISKLTELCDITLIDPGFYSTLPYYELNSFLDFIPKCVWIEVNAGEFGNTHIFGTKEDDYYTSGCANITNNINHRIQRDSNTAPYYNGFIQLRPGKKNDGSPQNYYLSLVLYIDDSPTIEIEEAELPKRKKTKTLKKKKPLAPKKKLVPDKSIQSKSKPSKLKMAKLAEKIKKDKKTIRKLIRERLAPKSLLEDYIRRTSLTEGKKIKNELTERNITQQQYKQRIKWLDDLLKK